MNEAYRFLVCAIAGCVLLAACGDSDDDSPSDDDMDASSQEASLDAGKDGETEPDPGPVMFTCPMDGSGDDVLECSLPEFDPGFLLDAGVTMIAGIDLENLSPEILQSFISVEACCTTDNKCGLTETMFIAPDGRCIEQAQAGDADGQCPDQPLQLDMGGLVELPITGCCRPDDECGLDLALLGAGCVSRAEVADLFSLILDPDAGLDPANPSIECSHGGAATDAGAEDGG